MNNTITVLSYIDSKVFSDFAAFNAFTLHNRWVSLALFPVIMFGLGLMNRYTGSEAFFWGFTALGLVLPLFYLFFYKVSLSRQIKAYALDLDLDTPRLAYTVTVNKEGVYVTNVGEKAQYTWDNMHGIYILDSAIYLYVTKARAFIMPYTGLQEGADAQSLAQMVQGLATPGRVRDRRRYK